MIRKLIWNNGVVRTGFGQPFFARSDSTVDDAGVPVAVNTARYSLPKLICPAPNLAGHRTTAVAGTRVWAGRWFDGSSPCLLELWLDSSSNTFKTGISVNVYGPETKRGECPIRS